MNEDQRKDIKFALLAGCAVALLVAALFSDGVGHSYRAGGGLVFGPAAIGYAFYGLSKGSFPEMSGAKRDVEPAQFWFVFGTLAVMGVCLVVIGIRAISV